MISLYNSIVLYIISAMKRVVISISLNLKIMFITLFTLKVNDVKYFFGNDNYCHDKIIHETGGLYVKGLRET